MDTNKIMKRLMTVTMSLMILLYCLTPCLPITEFNTVAANIQEVAVDDKVKQVALGSHHSACITEDGTLYTWGSNEYGQLGDGTLEDRSYPLKIMENVKQVSLGTNHSACITEDGSLYLWGNNYYGQIGNGKSSSNYKDGYAYVAEPIKIMNDVKQIELGENYSACITEDDSLYTWGWNEFGNLGNGEYGSDKYVTSPDKIMNNVKQVSICYEHSAAITKNGRLYMWGHNLYSFGDGGREDSYLPVRVMDDIDQIEVGYHFSTCIADNGTLYTWGRNDFGQLGNGRRGQNEIENYPLEIMKGVSQLETGFYNAACITSDGDMYTWGDYNTTPDKKIGNVKQASVSQSNYACVTNDGELYVWGDNEYGQIGNQTTNEDSSPVHISYFYTESIESIDEYIMRLVNGYTSDYEWEQFKNLMNTDMPFEAKQAWCYEMFHDKGITNMQDAVAYFREVKPEVESYLYLTTNENFVAYDWFEWINGTTKGNLIRGTLYAEGLIANREYKDYLNLFTYADLKLPGVKKNKKLLQDFLTSKDDKFTMAETANDCIEYIDKMMELNGYVATDIVNSLLNQMKECKDKETFKELAKKIFKIIFNENNRWDETVDSNGNKVYELKLPSERISSVLGSVSNVVTVVGATGDLVLQFMNMEDKIAKYEENSDFLNSIANSTLMSVDMRLAAASLLDDIDSGYFNSLKDYLEQIFKVEAGILDINYTSFDKILSFDKVFGEATGAIDLSTFIANLVFDGSNLVNQVAYVEGYAELGILYSQRLQEDRVNYRNSPNIENAWQFFTDYSYLCDIRACGEEQYIEMLTPKSTLFPFISKIKTSGYKTKESFAKSTIKRIANCLFYIPPEYEIPESVQYDKRTVIHCPVNVNVYNADGELIAELIDGEESSMTNEYGRFDVVYNPFTDSYTKVISQTTSDKLSIEIIAVQDGVVDFSIATSDSTEVFTSNKEYLKKGESISFGIDTVTEDNTYTIETSKGEKTADLTIVDEEARITDVSVPEDFIEVFVDKTISPKVSITPNNTINSNLEWYAVDDTIATVSDGIISGLKTGATQVYVKAMNKDDSVEEVSDTVTVIVSDKDKIFGDVNKDKAFNVSDLVNIEKWLLTGDGSVAVADFNDDGCVDTFDFIKYKQYYLYKNQKSK